SGVVADLGDELQVALRIAPADLGGDRTGRLQFGQLRIEKGLEVLRRGESRTQVIAGVVVFNQPPGTTGELRVDHDAAGTERPAAVHDDVLIARRFHPDARLTTVVLGQ